MSEFDQLTRTMNQGPARRISQDLAAGRQPDRCDVQRVARYQGLIAQALIEAAA